MHNLLNNIIPGAIAFAIIVGGIFWLIVDDIRRQGGKSPLRVRLPRRVTSKPATITPTAGVPSAR